MGPTEESKGSLWTRIYRLIVDESTFYRIHFAAFTFIPLIFSAIFYASNGIHRVSFIDSLFLCYSAMTVTGLTTVNLSTITAWQQFILYFQMAIGHYTIVSWIVVLMRRHFFRTKCEYVLKNRKSVPFISSPISVFKQRTPVPKVNETENDPLNFLGGQNALQAESSAAPGTGLADHNQEPNMIPIGEPIDSQLESEPIKKYHYMPVVSSSISYDTPPNWGETRSQNIGFVMPTVSRDAPTMRHRHGAPMKRSNTIMSSRSLPPPNIPLEITKQTQKYEGMGGFPGPTQMFFSLLRFITPKGAQKVTRLQRDLTTIPSLQTAESRNVPWLNKIDRLVIWRNSDFRTESLTGEQLEELGGAEYKALTLLTYLVPAYFIFWQLFPNLLFLPWLTVTKKYDSVFTAQPQLIGKPWFAFFQVMAAYSGGGLSLVDLGMLPFQDAYLMILVLALCILAGNHALPIFLRFAIWVASKVLPPHSDKQVALSFLLSHPRRCYLYMFPSHQTWFLVICLAVFSIIEWVGFLVLSIGLPVYDTMSVDSRIVDALFQGLAARASGFAIVPIASLAPALQVLYVVMMYIAVYPVALSIRSTNVYEERSLGIFEVPPDDQDEEPSDINLMPTRRERVGKYLAWHLRRQMSVDIWWLVWGIFLVCIIERKNLLDPSKKWFDIFRIVFELVSAFAGIGFSLGFPNDNFSFSGALKPLSKLVIIFIMLRGRHRGLPVAVDRAVLLPNELVTRTE